MKDTWLFNDIKFPITQNGDRLTMHAYSGCPGCSAVSGYGTANDYDNNKDAYDTCLYCKFTSDDFGSVASASTNATSGFEH